MNPSGGVCVLLFVLHNPVFVCYYLFYTTLCLCVPICSTQPCHSFYGTQFLWDQQGIVNPIGGSFYGTQFLWDQQGIVNPIGGSFYGTQFLWDQQGIVNPIGGVCVLQGCLFYTTLSQFLWDPVSMGPVGGRGGAEGEQDSRIRKTGFGPDSRIRKTGFGKRVSGFGKTGSQTGQGGAGGRGQIKSKR